MACQWETFTESYWTVCWKWIFPYPCKKYRTVTRWCCTFQWLKETGWGLFCTLEGCAGGQRYNWTAFCFNIFGTSWYYNIRKCFNSAKSPSGRCDAGGIG